MAVDNAGDFQALEPFFQVIEEGLGGLVDGGHFFDLLADDVVFEFIITVPGYPRRVEGRQALTGAVSRLPRGVPPRSLLRPAGPPRR
jgi:ketosteroid isomerase-like protein